MYISHRSIRQTRICRIDDDNNGKSNEKTKRNAETMPTLQATFSACRMSRATEAGVICVIERAGGLAHAFTAPVYSLKYSWNKKGTCY